MWGVSKNNFLRSFLSASDLRRPTSALQPGKNFPSASSISDLRLPTCAWSLEPPPKKLSLTLPLSDLRPVDGTLVVDLHCCITH